MKFLRYAILIPSLISMTFAAEEEGYFSPEALSIVQHLPTPLRKESLAFNSAWEPISRNLSGNYFAQYIDTVVNEDGIGKSLRNDRAMPLYKLIPFQHENVEEVDWPDFWHQAGNKFQALEEHSNAFGLYFLGVFSFYGYPLSDNTEEDPQQDLRERAKSLLNAASEKHYVRATRFMLKQKLWDTENGWNEHPITEEILETRESKILIPHQIILQHIQNKDLIDSTSPKDIKTLRELLSLLPGNPEQHKQTFLLWRKDLVSRLTSSKQRDSISLPAFLLLSSTFTGSLVLGANSISNIKKGNSNDEPDNISVGVTQGMASATGLLAALANAPAIINCWYGHSFQSLDDGSWAWPYKVPLLPSSYDNKEIIKQSALIVLYGILYNKEKLAKEGPIGSLKLKQYIEKLKILTLSSYQDDYEQALSTVITSKEEENFRI